MKFGLLRQLASLWRRDIKKVDEHSIIISDALNKSQSIPIKIVFKPLRKLQKKF